MESNREIRKYIDKAEIRLTYIYRLSYFLSPYLRDAAETRLFVTHHRFDDPIDYARVSTKGDTLEVVKDAKQIKLGGSFSPV